METENVVLLRMSREDTPTPQKKEKKKRWYTCKYDIIVYVIYIYMVRADRHF
jgi:hypothetical protein